MNKRVERGLRKAFGFAFAFGSQLNGVIWLVPVCLFVAGCYRKSTPETISIGHVVSLTGPDKAAGEQARRGVLLAVEEANENLLGGRRVEVLHADYGEDKKAIAGVAVRLIRMNKVSALLGGTNSAEAQALPTVAREYQIPLILSGGVPEDNPRDYVFHTGLPPTEHVEKLTNCAREILKAKTVGILTAGHNSSNGFLVDAFSRRFIEPGSGFSIAGKWIYNEFRKGTAAAEGEWDFKSAEDLKAIVNQVQERHPGAILLAGDAADLIKLRKAGLDEKWPVLFAGEEGGQGAFQAAPSAQAVYLATAFAPEDPTKSVQNFVQKFQDKFKEVPDVHAALAYDNARLLFQGLADTKQLEGSKIKDAIENTKTFEGVTGSLKLDVKDRWYSRPIIILRIENGKAVFVKRYKIETDNPENE